MPIDLLSRLSAGRFEPLRGHWRLIGPTAAHALTIAILRAHEADHG